MTTTSDRITSRRDGHWLIFDPGRRIAGCHCGFEADADSDCGWGDSVVDHIYNAGRASALRPRREPTDAEWAAYVDESARAWKP